MLLFLLLLLVSPYLLLTLMDPWRIGSRITPSTRARVGLSPFFIFTSIGHFIKAEEMSAMLPPFCSIPHRDHLSHGCNGDPRSHRCLDCSSRDANPFLPHPDADLFSARQHLFRNEPRGFWRPWGRSWLFTLSGSVPVLRRLVDVLCNQAEFVCRINRVPRK